MSRRALLSAQLAQLGAPSADPDARDVEQLGAVNQDDTEEVERDREHYLDVGPSRLRKGEVEQTLLSDKYGGQVRRRQKIFEDDEDESGDEGEGSGSEDGDSEEEEADEEDEDDDDDDDGGDEDDEDDEDDDEADEEEEDDEDDGASAEVGDGAPSNPVPSTTTASRTLDPLASLREARSKDVLKGQAIKRQRGLFETLTTLRITFQKALTATTSLSFPLEDDTTGNGEISSAKADALKSLKKLNERMFALREGLPLPGQPDTEGLGERKRKRKRSGEENEDEDEDETKDDQEYWLESAKESLAMSDATTTALIPILSKWSTKIQAASLSVGGKAAGSSKFLAGIKGQTGVLEAIESGMAAKRSNPTTSLQDLTTPSYRTLLREIITSRTDSSASTLPISSYRQEKKKKRDAERGASKGRKIRYTVHDKALNFAVAQPLRGAWGDDQTDELFVSLLGGAGMGGGRSEVRDVGLGVLAGGGGGGMEGVEDLLRGSNGAGGEKGEEGLRSLGGLRVF